MDTTGATFGPPETLAAVEYGSGATLTFGELEDRSRRLAGLWRARGITRGDHVAVLLDNRVAYFEVAWAALRSGLYLTPVNWHLGPEEAAYVVADCGARAVVSSAPLGGLLTGLGTAGAEVPTRLVVGGDVEGWEPYEAAVAAAEPIGDDDQSEGALMFYSSGTTGKPRGILPPLRDVPFGTRGALDMLTTGLFGFREGLTYLCPAPLYHAAPLAWSLASQRLGGTVVDLERFDAADALTAIGRPPGRARRGGDRRPRRGDGGAAARRRPAGAGRRAGRRPGGRAPAPLPGPPGVVQVPAGGELRGRAAPPADRQGPQERAARPLRHLVGAGPGRRRQPGLTERPGGVHRPSSHGRRHTGVVASLRCPPRAQVAATSSPGLTIRSTTPSSRTV
jgi:acyl-CoA synthetase (AMP-forming)/AMP-acid ligase II